MPLKSAAIFPTAAATAQPSITTGGGLPDVGHRKRAIRITSDTREIGPIPSGHFHRRKHTARPTQQQRRRAVGVVRLRMAHDFGHSIPVGFELIGVFDRARLHDAAAAQHGGHGIGAIDAGHALKAIQHLELAVRDVETRHPHDRHAIADGRDTGMQARRHHRGGSADDLAEQPGRGPP